MQAEVLQLREPETLPVAGTLHRTSRELRALAAATDTIQCLVGELLLERKPTDVTSLLELQRLDHLRQSIAGIADFLDALGTAAPSHWRLDAMAASRAVSVLELAQRLACAPDARPAAHATSHAADLGDLELFGSWKVG
jgi:hypothetical protein